CAQLYDYAAIFRTALKRLSAKRPLLLLDCGCGRSYLSFFLNYTLQSMGWNNLYFIGVDSNRELIGKCRDAASALGFANMEFRAGDIIDLRAGADIDIVYSLHACNTATDQTIFAGLANNAKYILSVSCCQHYARGQMKGHPLASVTRYGPYKERLADMVADSLRSLLLEACGYTADIFEFTPQRNTPKNVMLRAQKTGQSGERVRRAAQEYERLSAMFNVRPALEGYLAGYDFNHFRQY
ncbi:MAG: SAM-dependent methyltransferase, partial [Defluviitaleaceae bacterium]|nr:SAM-dependent methyltransferase [Defluviitaleaceae bacterium]